MEETRVSVRTADVRASVRLPDRDLTVEEQEHLNPNREDGVLR